MRVVFIYADSPAEWNCSEWRCKTVADAMNRASDWHAKLIHVSGFFEFLSPAVQHWLAPADIIVLQRNAVDQRAIDAIQYWQGMGKPVVIDLDDAYHILPWSNPAHRFWHERKNGEALVWLERALSISDGLTAPNRALLADWAHCVPGYYLPNFARREWWVDLPSRQEVKARLGIQDRIAIGWGGSVSHYDSWWGSGLREAASVIARKYPKVIWVICGNDPRIADQLPVPEGQKLAVRGVPPYDWPKVVRSFDVGVAPLFGPYDQRRSWIKGLEYLLAGVPWVGTQGEPYRDLNGLGRLIRNAPDNWISAISDILDNLREEQRIAEERRELASQWFIDQQLDTYRRVYGEIKANTEAERGRLPGLIYVNWGREPGRDPRESPVLVRNVVGDLPPVSGYSHCQVS